MPPKKKVTGLIKLQIQAGMANPAPPVGPALGAYLRGLSRSKTLSLLAARRAAR